MICARCHREIPDGSAFCNFCGKRQTAATPSPQRRSRRRLKGSGSVYKLSDKRAKPWVAMNGAGKLIGTYATSGEAVEMLDQFNADQTPLNRKDYTFSDIYEQWSPNAFAKIGEKSRASYEDAYAK